MNAARKTLFWLHLVAGCVAGIVILIMSVTGVMLAYQHQIVTLLDRGYRSVPPQTGAHRLPAEVLLASAAGAGAKVPASALTLRVDPTAPAEVAFGREQVVLVDVYTGKVLGPSAPAARTILQTSENLHRWLGAVEYRNLGRTVTGICNFAFLILIVTGPFLWLPRKWSAKSVRAVTLFRGGLSGRARDFNWHNVIGIWCAVPLFVIVISGVVMSFPWANNLVFQLTGSPAPSPNRGPRPEQRGQEQRGSGQHGPGHGRGANGAHSLALEPLFAQAGTTVPAWHSISLRLSPGRGPQTLNIDTGNSDRPDKRSQLTLDAQTARVMKLESFSTYNKGRQVRTWLRFLHTGEALGLTGQTVAAIASAGAAVLVWTGLWLSIRRFFSWKSRRRSATTTAASLTSVH